METVDVKFPTVELSRSQSWLISYNSGRWLVEITNGSWDDYGDVVFTVIASASSDNFDEAVVECLKQLAPATAPDVTDSEEE